MLKKYKSIYAFQEDYKTKEEREAFVAKLRNYEIDKLIDMCDSIQGKNYYEQQKKQEKVFGFSKHPALYCIGEAVPFVTVYDGPGTQKYAEYGDGLEETGKAGLTRKDIRAIQEAITDKLLFDTKHLEDPAGEMILDGTSYEFFFAVRGRENEMSGNNIEGCRGDDWNCMHSAHAIRALEAIRDILVPAGVPVKYFEL